MKRQQPEPSASGPAIDTHWEIKQIQADARQPVSLLVTADHNNPSRVSSGLRPLYYYLPQAPLLARDRFSRPVFSLTLILQRQPRPEDTSLEPLIERGVLAMTLTLDVQNAAIQQLAETEKVEYKPLFAQQVHFSLQENNPEPQTLSEQADGSGAWVALSTNLGREAALDVLSALQGAESRLHINVLVNYRTAMDTNRTLTLQGSWQKIYEFLASRFLPGTEFGMPELRVAFDEILRSGLILVHDESNSPVNTVSAQDSDLFLQSFLRISTLITRRLTLDLAIENSANRYVLRNYAPEGELSIGHTISGSAYEKFIELSSPLQDLLYGTFDGQDMDAFIRLVSPTYNGGFGTAPRKVKMIRTRAVGTREQVGLVASNQMAGSLSLALQPSSQARPTPHTLLASDAIQNIDLAHPAHQTWSLNDFVIGDGGVWFGNNQPAQPNLPLVEDQAAPLWPDRRDTARFWYPPTFEVVNPELNADPTTSPFLFRLTASGHDLSGQTGLDGTIHFTIRKGMSEATQAALQARGNPTAFPVALTSLSVALDLPFRDQSGATRRQLFPATTQPADGDTIRVTLQMIDNWVRLVYGALAFANFQGEPARIQISYTYSAYVPVDFSRLEILYGGKLATIPIILNPEDVVTLGSKSYFNAQDGTFHPSNGVLHFSREMQTTREGPSQAGKSSNKAKGKSASKQEHSRSITAPSTTRSYPPESHIEERTLRPVSLAPITTTLTVPTLPIQVHNTPIIHPPLEIHPIEVKPEQEKKYAVQTLGTTLQQQVLFPCEKFGVLYRQEIEEGMQTIGCMDVLKLGQTEYQQYRLLTGPEFRSPFYSIYRSLQMPERFLVVPTAYRISRFGPDEAEKAYRPTCFLYSTIDTQNLANSRCVIVSTLQPDVPAFAQRELADKLSLLFHRSPSIEYITEIESQVHYEWSLPSTGAHAIQTKAAKLWDSFQVSLSTDVDGIPQLQAMLEGGAISAHVVFTLPDETEIGTNFYLDLREIIGPWKTGPLEINLKEGNVRLTNHIEREVNVSDLRAYAPGQAMQSVQVDSSLAKDEVWEGSVPPNATELYPVYAARAGVPATLQEIRSFIEDIHTNVIFLNQVNYANHQLKKLDISARVRDLPGTYNFAIPDEQSPASVDIVLPLTSFLASPVLQFQVTKTDTSDQVSQTPWLDWSLTTMGNIVSLTWALIENSQT